jgi:glycosyltransferase involved in cell wall biosynthesis
MYHPKVSIIIRTRNDAGRIQKLLDTLLAQDYAGEVEIILVDTSSTDGTASIARARGAKIVSITQNEFSYPKSVNAGMREATGELAILTVGHAIPFTGDWIASGVRHFADARTAGVFSPPIAREDAPIVEKLFYLQGYLKARFFGAHSATSRRWPGILGATNCMIRRSLWETHPFDEAYGLGGEDVAWARWAIAQEYKIICDYKFSLRHSHCNNFANLRKQIAYWRSLGTPRPFDRNVLNFRKDIDLGA